MLADYVQNKHIDQNLSLAGHHAVSRGNDAVPSSTGRAPADQRLLFNLFLTHQPQPFACTYDALLYFNSIACQIPLSKLKHHVEGATVGGTHGMRLRDRFCSTSPCN